MIFAVGSGEFCLLGTSYYLISKTSVCRPATEEIRVTPSDFPAYRTAHEFKVPCCLCAISAGDYTECAIYLAVKGKYAGEYVCGCAFDSCGYLGKCFKWFPGPCAF